MNGLWQKLHFTVCMKLKCCSLMLVKCTYWNKLLSTFITYIHPSWKSSEFGQSLNLAGFLSTLPLLAILNSASDWLKVLAGSSIVSGSFWSFGTVRLLSRLQSSLDSNVWSADRVWWGIPSCLLLLLIPLTMQTFCPCWAMHLLDEPIWRSLE